MRKFFVTPITPLKVFNKYFINKNVVISFLRAEQYKQAVKNNCNIYFDNGAYTYFRKKIKPDWDKFYKFLENKIYERFFIPDIIDGTEEENNKLIQNLPKHLKPKAIPVFHLHESNQRLIDLIQEWDYIALGSSGKYWKIGTLDWFLRMNELMKILCDEKGNPKVKIHMLRCLDEQIFTKFPFYSGDSSNFARNHHSRDHDYLLKCLHYNSPDKYIFTAHQITLFELLEKEVLNGLF